MNRFQLIIAKLLPVRKKIRDEIAQVIGGLQSPFDPRDCIASGTLLEGAPDEYTIPNVSRVEQQGEWNSCVAHAITTAVETMVANSNHDVLEVSRMHAYNLARMRTWGSKWTVNKGVYIRDGWKALQNDGVTIEKLFPYQPDYATKTLDQSWVWRAYPSFRYEFITGDKDTVIRSALLQNKPVVFGINVPPSFYSPNGGVYAPLVSEGRGGGHCMLLIGYSQSKEAYLVRNSWGVLWGDTGNLWVSKEWILSEAYDLSVATPTGA